MKRKNAMFSIRKSCFIASMDGRLNLTKTFRCFQHQKSCKSAETRRLSAWRTFLLLHSENWKLKLSKIFFRIITRIFKQTLENFKGICLFAFLFWQTTFYLFYSPAGSFALESTLELVNHSRSLEHFLSTSQSQTENKWFETSSVIRRMKYLA